MTPATAAPSRRPSTQDWFVFALVVLSAIGALAVASQRSFEVRLVTVERCAAWWNDTPPVDSVRSPLVGVTVEQERLGAGCRVAWIDAGGACRALRRYRESPTWFEEPCRSADLGPLDLVVVRPNRLELRS
ncbi:MAG: hypothetical protein AAGA93_10805 [Actinomycetota bacterium]